jgi:N6-adenosine-specific RNA methylase IME4
MTGKRYSVIYADPPWRYSDKSLHRGGAERHYPTMPVKEIARLNIQAIAAPDCVLFLWVTDPFIARGVHTYIAERWGFTIKSKAFTWIKTTAELEAPAGADMPSRSLRLAWGMGHWTRANPETCWLAIRGKPKRVDAGVHSVIIAPRGAHSAKPPEARDRIVRLCGDVPRIELFARDRVHGWDAWGNEVPSE